MLRRGLISSGREPDCESGKCDFEYHRSPLSVFLNMKENMNDKYAVSMNLTGLDLLVLSTLIEHIRLGEDNEFEEAISKLAIDLEDDEVVELIRDARDRYGDPQLVVTASMDDGIVLNLE